MKNNFFLLCIILFFFSCKQTTETRLEYDNLKKVAYADLNSQQKFLFKNELIAKLKVEPSLIEFNELITKQANAYLAGNNERMKRGMKSNTLDPNLNREEREKALGIADPITYEKNRIKMMMDIAIVTKKYPEFTKLDRATRNEVLKLASKKTNIKLPLLEHTLSNN